MLWPPLPHRRHATPRPTTEPTPWAPQADQRIPTPSVHAHPQALEYLQGSGIRQVLQTILEKILSVHKCPPDFQDVLLGELRAVARAREGYQPPVE